MGIGSNNVYNVPCNDRGQMDLAKLEEVIEKSKKEVMYFIPLVRPSFDPLATSNTLLCGWRFRDIFRFAGKFWGIISR